MATLGLCAAGWLALAPVAFGYRNAGPHEAALTDWATGAGLAVVSLITLIFWVVAWRRKLRADGILARTSWWQARREARAQRRREHEGGGAAGWPDPDHDPPGYRAPSADPACYEGDGYQPAPAGLAVPPARSGGLAAVESMLAGGELLMVGCGEEEAW